MYSVKNLTNRNLISVFLVVFSLVFLSINLYSLFIGTLLISVVISGDKLIKGFLHLFQVVFHTFLALVIISATLFLLMIVLVYFFT